MRKFRHFSDVSEAAASMAASESLTAASTTGQRLNDKEGPRAHEIIADLRSSYQNQHLGNRSVDRPCLDFKGNAVSHKSALDGGFYPGVTERDVDARSKNRAPRTVDALVDVPFSKLPAHNPKVEGKGYAVYFPNELAQIKRDVDATMAGSSSPLVSVDEAEGRIARR
jgi:hypothetical protein